MGTIGEAIRQRRSLLRSGGTGLILNAGLVLLVALFGILLIQRIYDQGASFFLQILAFALANGGIYALIALGYTMVYGIIELINFAHGDIFMLGAFLAVVFTGGILGQSGAIRDVIPLILIVVGALAFTMPIIGLLNVAIERTVYRPLRNAPRLAPLITAIGVSCNSSQVTCMTRHSTTVSRLRLLRSFCQRALPACHRYPSVSMARKRGSYAPNAVSAPTYAGASTATTSPGSMKILPRRSSAC